ncbi:Uncharacterised protein [Serratia marcescens]|nr:Uncharacterised protein [Serratia marcescens]
MRPAVELAGRQLDVVGIQLDRQFDDAVDLADIMAMQHEVEHHRIAERLDCPGHRQLLLKRPGGTRQRGVQRFVAGLKTDLNMIQPGVGEGLQFLLGQADAGGDQVGVKPEIARSGDQFGQVFTHQRLAAGEAELHAAHRPRLAKHLYPLRGGQLFFLRGKIERVGAVRTLQRAAVGQLRQQPEGRIHRRRTWFSHGRSPIFVRRHAGKTPARRPPTLRRRGSGRSAGQ